MAFKVVISCNAETEISIAYDYYARFSKSAVMSFRKQLIYSYKKIQQNPFFEIRYLDIRALPIRKYPYILFFRVNELTKTIYILSVFCTHQNPEKYP